MSQADLTASVRACVHALFAELRFGSFEEGGESILIRGGAYCGRRFEAKQGHAVWFVEEDQLKFVAANGRVVRVVDHVSLLGRELQAAA